MLLTVGMAVKTVAEAVAVVMALAWAKSGSASTHQHAESTATSQTSNQPNKRYIDATLAWKSAALLGSIPEWIREQPRSCIAHHHKFVALPQTSFWPTNAQ